jgi:hypothetical protein
LVVCRPNPVLSPCARTYSKPTAERSALLIHPPDAPNSAR